MIWLQKFGSNSLVSELNQHLLPKGSRNQMRCSVRLHPGLFPRRWSTCTGPSGFFGLGLKRADTSVPQRLGSLSLGKCH